MIKTTSTFPLWGHFMVTMDGFDAAEISACSITVTDPGL